MRILQLGVVALGLMGLSGGWSGAALAGPSNAVFAYTDGTTPGSVFLTLNTAGGSRTVNASLAGAYDQNGGLVTGNYLAGVCGSSDGCLGDDLSRHDFFVFSLSGLSARVISATLNLFNPEASVDPGLGTPIPPGYISTAPSLTYTNFDVASALDPVTGTSAAANVYGDLGSGAIYGSTVVSPLNNGQFVSVTLNAAALTALNQAAGGNFSIGGSVTSVPEPISLALFGLGLGALTFARRPQAMRS